MKSSSDVIKMLDKKAIMKMIKKEKLKLNPWLHFLRYNKFPFLGNNSAAEHLALKNKPQEPWVEYHGQNNPNRFKQLYADVAIKQSF